MAKHSLRVRLSWSTVSVLRVACLGAGLVAAVGFAPVRAADANNGNWIGSWTAPAQPVWTADFPVPLGLPSSLWKQTIRQNERLSIGGSRVRIVLSNEYGDTPLHIGDAHIALAADDGAIKSGSDHAITFDGNPSIVIPPGAPVVSDPIDFAVDPLSLLSVSLYLPDITPTTTMHWDGHETAFVAAGDKAGDVDFKVDSKQTQRVFLTEILVDAAPGARAVVAFGDSITDGDGSTVDGNDRWPDRLAERLVKAGGPPIAVLNQGISGEKVLSDRMGVNALARFDRDILTQPHADTIILMMGINDIGWPGSGLALHDPEPTAADIIEGYKQLIDRAHIHGMRIIGATLTPFDDAFVGTPFEGYYTPDKEKIRVALNEFIRSGAFDGVIDFDKVIEDPQNPGHSQMKLNKGDHLHPNAAGYDAMAGAINLKTLTTSK